MRIKRFMRAVSLALCLALALQPCAPALAEGENGTVFLNDANDLLAFARMCAYDAWSEGKTVVLQRDIALGGVDFPPIASFGGTFEGGGHTISGLNISSSVSPAGLFGTVAESGVVRELNVEGAVAPAGSADLAGGIAGVNRGTLVDCTFVGTVNGEKRTGGVAGENAATGTLRRCDMAGGVFGKNMTGGVVGANHGTVSFCVNRAYVNTNTIDPSVSFDKLDLNPSTGLNSLVSPDTYNVTVDSGGVAGFSDGALFGCRNYGSVGYQHVGYNVGGVAGRSSGHMASCGNEGSVCGRREVGGVVGMAEPYVKLNMKEDSLDRVRSELNALSELVDRTVNDAESGSQTVSARLSAVNRSVDDATDNARALTGQLTDYWDGTVREIDRGAEVAATVISQLRDVSEDMRSASSSFTDALKLLRDAMDSLGALGVSSELSAMANDLEEAAGIFDRATASISSGLGKLGAAAELNKNALKQLSAGASTTAAGMREVSAALRVAKDASTIDELVTALHGDELTQGMEKTEEGLGQLESGLAELEKNADATGADVGGGLSDIQNGLDLLTGAKGGRSAFKCIADSVEHLSKAAAAGEASIGGFTDAVSGFCDASEKLTGALDKTEKLLAYLERQDKLRFETLGDKTDATADALYGSMRDISGNLELLNQEAKSASDTVLEDVRAINRQFTTLMNTLLDVAEDMGGASAATVVEDTSDEDVDDAVNGKVLLCVNSGEVAGDIDVGGVAGAMMIYNELDPESDTKTLSSTFHKRYELKCILQSCTNEGNITGKRDNVGSVCGSATLGVISGCEAYGTARSEGGDYVGGVAGQADNVVRKCWAKCSLSGEKYIGGVVGGGKDERSSLRVEGCRALVDVTDGKEYTGSIMGAEAGELNGNLFVSDTLAGVNRVSARGRAEPVTYESLLGESGLPAAFRHFTLRFVADGKAVSTQRFDYGDSLDDSAFPEIPQLEGKFGRWDRGDLRDLRFDTTVTAIYEPCVTTVGSEITRSAGRPTFFVLGAFDDAAVLEAFPAMLDFNDGQDDLLHRLRSYRRALLEQWQLVLPEGGGATRTVRYLPPEGTWGHLELYVSDGANWKRLETGEMGSYLTFETDRGEIELTVISTATPWWVWALVGGFLTAAAALVLQLLLRRRPKKTVQPPGEQTPEERAKLARQRKKRRTVRAALVAAALVLGAAVGAAIMLAPKLTESMGLYMLLRNYAGRTDTDMEIDISAQLDQRSFDTDVTFFTTRYNEKRVSCVMWQDIPLYYCDGAMLLENGKAYRAGDVPPDYSAVLTHAAQLFRAVNVTASEENGVKTYHAAAQGETAAQTLASLLPAGTELITQTGAVDLDLVVTDGEPTSLDIRWSDGENSASACLRAAGRELDHTLPQEVRAAIGSGEYADAPEAGEDVRRLLLACTDLATRDPLGADVTLRADCGPLIVDEKLDWQRTGVDGTELYCVTRRGTQLYYTDDAVSTAGGVAVSRDSGMLTGTPKLLRLAYEAFLLGEAECTQAGADRRYSVTLNGEEMARFAEAVAPEIATMDAAFAEGSVRLELKDDAVAAIAVQCKGSVRVVRTDVPASFSAHLSFHDEAFPQPAPKVLEALDLK